MKRAKGSSLPPFKIQLRSYRKEDIERLAGPNHKADHVDRDIPREKWQEHGFSTTMTLENAREFAKQKNAQERIKEETRARAMIQERFKREDEVECAFLPPGLVFDFESKLARDHGGSGDFNRSKIKSHWRAVKRLIRDLQIDPRDWEDESISFYKYFIKKQWSISYCEKLLIISNKWGYFCAKRSNTFYQPVPFPRGKWRSKISESYYDSVKNTKESKPLKPQHLVKAKSRMKEEQYNWLFISFWFGLRPREVDALVNGEGSHWQLEIQKGKKVLKVYQPKLINIEKDRRWKLIPCLFDEQSEALKLIKGGNFKRPLVKTLRNHLGEGLTTYAGRKGFESLLHSKKIPFAAISAYLGHVDVNRTWNNYRGRERAVFPEEFAEYQADVVKLRDRKKEGAA